MALKPEDVIQTLLEALVKVGMARGLREAASKNSSRARPASTPSSPESALNLSLCRPGPFFL